MRVSNGIIMSDWGATHDGKLPRMAPGLEMLSRASFMNSQILCCVYPEAG